MAKELFNGKNAYAVYTKEDSSIHVNFKELLDDQIDDIYCSFSLEKKRVYKNLALAITKDVNHFLEISETYKYSLLSVKFNILSKDVYTEDEFTRDMLAIFNESLSNEIIKYVEDNTVISLDEHSRTAKNVNLELQLTDEHAAIILRTSVAERLIIPLLTDYMLYHYEPHQLQGHNKADERLAMKIFSKILIHFNHNEEIDIFNKLYRFVSARVYHTRSSDKIIWAYLKNLSKDVDSTVRNMVRSTIIATIPKLEIDKSLISFLHAVIKRSIQNIFTYNYPVKYRPVSSKQHMGGGGDELTEFDKLQINMVKFDEGQYAINKQALDYEIKEIYKKFNLSISEDEFEYYKTNIVINKFQTNLIFMLFAKSVGSYNSLYACNYDQYILLAYAAKEILKHYNLQFMSKIVVAISDTNRRRKNGGRNKDILALLENPKYKRLFNTKYSNVEITVIPDFIKTLRSHPFLELPEYEVDGFVGKVEESYLLPVESTLEPVVEEFVDYMALI